MLLRKLRKTDFVMVTVILLLSAFSCIAIYAIDVGHTTAQTGWGKQVFLEGIGFLIMLATMFFDFRSLRSVARQFYAITILLLLAVFAIGKTINGAHSWIGIGPLTFQPSELAKLAMIVVMAHYMAKVEESEFPSYGLKHFGLLFLIMLVPFALTYKEPALGQAIVMFATFVTMFVVFTRRSYFVALTSFFILVVLGTAFVAVSYSSQALYFINHVIVGHHILKSYQVDRIITWLNPSAQLQGAGFNVHFARMAIGSGQIFGQGVGPGGVFVPNQTSDYIFSIIGQDFGFLGSSVLILLFTVLVQRTIRIAQKSQDYFGTYFVVGIAGVIGFQVFENVGMDLYMSPSTGITLPFISAGGSSLWVFYFAIGVVLSVGIHSTRKKF